MADISVEDFSFILDLLMLNIQSRRPSKESENKKKLNWIIIGKTGLGKSATGNTVLGSRVFKTSDFVTSITNEVTCKDYVFGDYQLKIVDTPGLADTNNVRSKHQYLAEVIEHFTKAVSMCPEGVHAFLFVVKFNNRMAQEDTNVLNCFRQIFGDTFLSTHGILVFTSGDMFKSTMEEEGTPEKDFHKWCHEQTGKLGNLMQECDYRVSLFNNREKDGRYQQIQLDNLILLTENILTPYKQNDYEKCKNSRQNLIFDAKVEQLRPQFKEEIYNLNSAILRTITSENPKTEELEILKKQADDLKLKIQNEDNNSGMFEDQVAQLAQAKLQIYEFQPRRQTEAAGEKKKSGCFTS